METSSSPPPPPPPSFQSGQSNSKNPISQLEEFLDLYLVKKAPFQLPPNAKEWIVKLSPWLTIIFMLLLLPLLLLALGLGTIGIGFLALSGRVVSGVWFYIQMGLVVVMMIIELMAIPGLFKRTRKAWRLLFYLSLFNAAMMLVEGNISGLILGTLIGLYILFQVKELYNK